MSLKDKGYIFGLGAFRRYEQHFDASISNHFDVVFRLTEEMCESLVKEGRLDQKVADMLPKRTISDVESNYRWAAMLKFANDVYIAENGGEQTSIDSMSNLLSDAGQDEFMVIYNQFLDSYYMGKKMRVYYGIPEPEETKKKPSRSAKRSPQRTKSATSGKK